MPAKGQLVPLKTRFWKYVKRGRKHECWTWFGDIDRHGYGRILVYPPFVPKGRATKLAHRVSFVMHKRKIPKGLLVLHNCNNRACINPNHLRLGTHQENMADRRIHGTLLQGERAVNAKLTAADVLAIRRDTRYQYEIAKDYGIIQAHVSRIQRRVVWTHI